MSTRLNEVRMLLKIAAQASRVGLRHLHLPKTFPGNVGWDVVHKHSSLLHVLGLGPRSITSSSKYFRSSRDDTSESKDYTIFYRFPHIRMMRAISRMKIYQTGLTVIFLPYMSGLYLTGGADNTQLLSAFGIASFAGVMLYSMSHYFRRLIGIMAVNQASDTVRVSHLTFWGRRNDIFVPVEDIVPLSELHDQPNDVYIKFCRYSSKDFLYYSIAHGNIIDKKAFETYLGRIM